MKVALCLSGHFRNFEKCYHSLYRFILKPLNCDVFIHTWDKIGYQSVYKTDANLNDIKSKIDLINSLYLPKCISIQNTNNMARFMDEASKYASHLITQPKHPGHMASMFYKINACNELRKEYEKQNNIKYDCVIRCRPDLLFTSGIESTLLNNLTQLILPKIYNFHNGYNDQFAISNSNYMNIYSSFYHELPGYFNAKNEYYPEKFMKWAIEKHNIKINFSNITYQIIR